MIIHTIYSMSIFYFIIFFFIQNWQIIFPKMQSIFFILWNRKSNIPGTRKFTSIFYKSFTVFSHIVRTNCFLTTKFTKPTFLFCFSKTTFIYPALFCFKLIYKGTFFNSVQWNKTLIRHICFESIIFQLKIFKLKRHTIIDKHFY